MTINKMSVGKDIACTSPEKLEQLIGYSFNDKDLLIESLSHPSLKQHILKQENQKNYERLELLGDAILNFIITEILFKNFSNYNEGKLAKIRAYLVCKDVLCKVASKINLSNYIIMTHGEEISGGRHNLNNIENTMEALIAAIYLDSNINVIRDIIHNLWFEFISITDLTNYDPKTTLQEWSQSIGPDKPVYRIIQRDGSAHSSTFTVIVEVRNYQQTGSGYSVKEAEKDAARKLLHKLELCQQDE